MSSKSPILHIGPILHFSILLTRVRREFPPIASIISRALFLFTPIVSKAFHMLPQQSVTCFHVYPNRQSHMCTLTYSNSHYFLLPLCQIVTNSSRCSKTQRYIPSVPAANRLFLLLLKQSIADPFYYSPSQPLIPSFTPSTKHLCPYY